MAIPIHLSWEEHHPERATWTAHTVAQLESRLPLLSTAEDMGTFAPSYSQLPAEQQLSVWAEFVSGLAKFESSWNACNRYREATLGKDALTGEDVYSEGLLQLSYQDVLSYPQLHLPFDWNRDKVLARDDCGKTILDPMRNLTGGIAILAHQIETRHKIVLKHPYWSTLGPPGNKYSKVNELAAMVRGLLSAK